MTGDKWQSKTLFLVIFDPHSLIDKSIFDCHLSRVILLLIEAPILPESSKFYCSLSNHSESYTYAETS